MQQCTKNSESKIYEHFKPQCPMTAKNKNLLLVIQNSKTGNSIKQAIFFRAQTMHELNWNTAHLGQKMKVVTTSIPRLLKEYFLTT